MKNKSEFISLIVRDRENHLINFQKVLTGSIQRKTHIKIRFKYKLLYTFKIRDILESMPLLELNKL
jgi:ribonucleotide reductase beta subunit family protein with ferritin-like domain